MKILVVADWYPSKADPVAGIFVQDQVRTLATEHEVAVVAPRIYSWRSVRAGVPHRRSRSSAEARDAVARPATIAVPFLRAGTDSWYLGAVRRGLRTVSRAWGTPELIHAHGALPAGHAAVLLGRDLGIPVIVTEHASDFASYLRTRHSRRVLDETIRGADRMVAVGRQLRERIGARDPSIDISLVGNVIDTDFFAPADWAAEQPTQRRVRFLSVGSLIRRKGHDTVLRAVALLAGEADFDPEVVLIGRGPERQRLAHLARYLGIEERTTLVGSGTREQVRDWMWRSDVLVSGSRRETFGVSVAEALASGLPVVATRCGGPEDIVEPGLGLIVNPDDPSMLALAMRESARVSGDRRHWRHQRIVDRFGPAAFLREMNSIYTSAVARRSRRLAVQSKSG